MSSVLDVGTFYSNLFLHCPSASFLWFPFIIASPLRKLRVKYLTLIETMITSRTAQPKDAKHDLYSFVADALGTESGDLRQSDLWAEANLFLPAAGDTAKTALSATFFYLSRNPHAYQTLAHEIRSTFTSSSDIRGASLAPYAYLHACIDEAMRLSPPSPGILWRDLAPDDDTSQPSIVDGHVVPPGTVVGVNTYSLHHNEAYFPEPFAFRPERWLSENGNSFSAEQKKVMREALAPFSIGPRGCAGKAMAYLESSLALAKTLWFFDFEVAEGELGEVGAGKMGLGEGRERREEFQLEDTFGSIHDGPYLTFRTRGEFWKEL